MTRKLHPTMPLTFFKSGSKWYARTPAGELAFGDHQGLYAWTNGQRIDYTGGDKQAAIGGRMLQLSAQPDPRARGIASARAHGYFGGGEYLKSRIIVSQDYDKPWKG